MKKKEGIMIGLFSIITPIVIAIPTIMNLVDKLPYKNNISEKTTSILVMGFTISFFFFFTVIGIKMILSGIKNKNSNDNKEVWDINTTMIFIKNTLQYLLIIGIVFSLILNSCVIYYRWNQGSYKVANCINAQVVEIIDNTIIIEYKTGTEKKEESLDKRAYLKVKVGDHIKVHCKTEKKNTEKIDEILKMHILLFFIAIFVISLNPLIWFIYIVLYDFIKKHNKSNV